MGVGVQRHAPAAVPGKENRYPLYKRLGGSEDLSGLARKISTSPVLDPRTFQPAASRYTDYAIPAQWTLVNTIDIPVLRMTVNCLSSWVTSQAALRLLVLGASNRTCGENEFCLLVICPADLTHVPACKEHEPICLQLRGRPIEHTDVRLWYVSSTVNNRSAPLP
jgi:hypothetical protein